MANAPTTNTAPTTPTTDTAPRCAWCNEPVPSDALACGSTLCSPACEAAYNGEDEDCDCDDCDDCAPALPRKIDLNGQGLMHLPDSSGYGLACPVSGHAPITAAELLSRIETARSMRDRWAQALTNMERLATDAGIPEDLIG